jgi:hypothetical protein
MASAAASQRDDTKSLMGEMETDDALKKFARFLLGTKTKADKSLKWRIIHDNCKDLRELCEHLLENPTKIKATLVMIKSCNDVAELGEKKNCWRSTTVSQISLSLLFA